jgi:hypothetical protein
MCFGIADATESRTDVPKTDSFRDATVFTEADAAGGRGVTRVSLEAAEDELRRLMAGSSFGGTGGTGCSGKALPKSILPS